LGEASLKGGKEMNGKKLGIVTSGMRPSGSFHLGNLLGALVNWVRLQEEYECYYFIVDWHTLTDEPDTSELTDNIRTMAIDWLSAGLDPEKSNIFVQSQIKELTELHLLLSMTTPVGWLERLPTYRERLREQHIESPGYGLLGYAVLMAADILIYGGTEVPVGEDQVPHVEFTQEIARRFNNIYGNVLTIPRTHLTPEKRVPGTDWRKMSKRYRNAIEITMTEEQTKAKVQECFTDPQKIHLGDPGHPIRTYRDRLPTESEELVVGKDSDTGKDLVVDNPGCVAYTLHEIYSPDNIEVIRRTCENGTRPCVGCKDELAERINVSLSEIRQRRKELVNNPEYVEKSLAEGAAKARERAQATMDRVRRAMKMYRA
jgi:tryptophanyl-tRNA synthetase